MTDPAAGIHAALRRRGETVAVAESLTGGLLAASLTETAGASTTFRGGLVVYATDLKSVLAGVPAAVLAEHGPVHEEVAAALAMGVSHRCGADWGVGVTGVAGPETQGGHRVGTVFVAVARGDRLASVDRLDIRGERADVRSGAVQAALQALSECVLAAED
ncbi:MAG: nicotinamide-nucleotide amidohydrolase family protein [Mycobacteriales bacterium]